MLVLDLWSRDKTPVKLKIDGNQLLIEFLPKTNSQSEVHAAAVLRNRFNFSLSMYLSSFIRDELDYEENCKLETDDNSFSVFLQFKKNVDLEIVEKIFNQETSQTKENKPTAELLTSNGMEDETQKIKTEKKDENTVFFSEFIAEECRAEMLTKVQLYLRKPEEDQLVDSSAAIPSQTKQSRRASLSEVSQQLLEESDKLIKQIIQETNAILTRQAELEQIVELRTENLKKATKLYLETKKEISSDLGSYTSAFANLDKLELNSQDVQSDFVSDPGLDNKLAKQHNEFNNTIELITKKLAEDKLRRQQHAEIIQADEENLKEIESESMSSSKLSEAPKWHKQSMTLLHSDMKEKQTVLMYATLADQLHVRKLMQEDSHPDKAMYDDLYFRQKRFFFDEDESHPYATEEEANDRQEATRITEAAMKRAQDLAKKDEDEFYKERSNSILASMFLKVNSVFRSNKTEEKNGTVKDHSSPNAENVTAVTTVTNSRRLSLSDSE